MKNQEKNEQEKEIQNYQCKHKSQHMYVGFLKIFLEYLTQSFLCLRLLMITN